MSSEQKLRAARELFDEYGGVASAAGLAMGLHGTTLQVWFRRVRDERENGQVSSPVLRGRGDLTTLLFASDEDVTAEAILDRLNMNPDEMRVTNIAVTEWEAMPGEGAAPVPMLRVNCKIEVRDLYLVDLLNEAWSDAAECEIPKGAGTGGSWDTWVADPHFPHNESVITNGFLAFCEEFEDIIRSVNMLGDGPDASPFKRHRNNKRTDTDPKGTFVPFRRWLRHISERVPEARRRAIRGNHCAWVLQRLAELNPEVLDIPLGETDEQFFTLERILQLDLIGWEYTQPMGGLGEYFDDHIVTEEYEDLFAHHGVATGKHGGAIKELESGFEGSWIQGHAHTLAMIGRVVRTPKDGEILRLALDVPAMSKRDLGYSHRKNVGQGWLVTVDHGNGRWHPEYAIYWPQDNRITFRDWSYSE